MKVVVFLLVVATVALTRGDAVDDSYMHPMPSYTYGEREMDIKTVIEDADFWFTEAQKPLSTTGELSIEQSKNEAKNVILFLGDGMSSATVTAARILKGQNATIGSRGGEEAELHMDSFPITGMSRTYCVDRQVADSACSATAYLSGIKANYYTIGVKPSLQFNDCANQENPENHASSIMEWAQAAGKSTGVVTTTRITHASPAGAYAHIANRNWEDDTLIINDVKEEATKCKDIAHQLIMSSPGNKLNVIMGGGRVHFFPKTVKDPETGQDGSRTDTMDLINEWKNQKKNSKATYITSRADLLKVNPAETDYLLGLFAPDHLAYYHEQERDDDPTLEQMTSKAIEILSKNPKGFVLFVEGGRIDHAHHDTMAQRALWETLEFDKAIKAADDMTGDLDSLITVTSDHAHTFSIAGYPSRGNGLLSINDKDLALDDLPYSTINYANGPNFMVTENGVRPNLSTLDMGNLDYKTVVGVPLDYENHGGDDVIIFAKGAHSHLFTGVQEQNFIPHALAYAACLDVNYPGDLVPRGVHCPEKEDNSTAAGANLIYNTILLTLPLIIFSGTYLLRPFY